jgi:hypothetical protein
VEVLAQRPQLTEAASMSSSMQSIGCEVVKRRRSRPGTASTARNSSAKCTAARSQVFAVGVHVLPEQRDVAHARRHERLDLAHHQVGGFRDLAAAREGHDAKAADLVAALHDRDELADLPGDARLGLDELVVLARYEGRLGHPALALAHTIEDLRELRDVVGPHHQVEIGHAVQSSRAPSCCATQPATPSTSSSL